MRTATGCCTLALALAVGACGGGDDPASKPSGSAPSTAPGEATAASPPAVAAAPRAAAERLFASVRRRDAAAICAQMAPTTRSEFQSTWGRGSGGSATCRSAARRWGQETGRTIGTLAPLRVSVQGPLARVTTRQRHGTAYGPIFRFVRIDGAWRYLFD